MQKIKSSLTLGLSTGLVTISLLMAIFGFIAQNQVEGIWSELDGLYVHPLTVQIAVSALRDDVLMMNISMKDMVLVDNATERSALVEAINSQELDAEKQFSILSSRYLGPSDDIQEARADFDKWKSIRDTALKLGLEGRTSEAAEYAKPSGPGGEQVILILESLDDIRKFADQKGKEFYVSANTYRDNSRILLGGSLTIALTVAWIILYAISSSIAKMQNELKAVTARYVDLMKLIQQSSQEEKP